jgi:hypothetical protein
MESETEGHCEFCGREKPLTKHHLIPRAVHRKTRYVKEHGKEEMRERGLELCKLCHDGIHDLFSERELADSYNTKESLLSDERVRRHIRWVRKQK